MRVINLTPHAVNFITDAGTITIDPSGTVARVSVSTDVVDSIDVNGISVPITTSVFGQVVDLPDPQDDTVFIVSSIVANRVKDRTDVFIPDQSVRDDQGRIIGAKSFGRVS